jgi:hypothetical protein
MYIVTVKLEKNPEHNPHSKITGQCPVGIGTCTDVTGEHHSFIVENAKTIEEAREHTLKLGPNTHITRIEELHPVR